MGKWQLEATRMFIYLTFPIGVFVLFNTPAFYERSMRSIFASYSKKDLENLQKFQKLVEERQFAELDKTIAEIEIKSSKAQ